MEEFRPEEQGDLDNLDKFTLTPIICIFPSDRDDTKPMNAQTVNQTLKRLKDGKYKGRIVSHGFRAMASTILNESKLFRSDVIEKQLAHQENNKVRGAYNHAEYLEERTEMMCWYGDYLNSLIN